MAKTLTYNKDTDYQALIDDAVTKGDYAAAAEYEQHRNAKIKGEGLNYGQTNKYSDYDDDYSDNLDYSAMLNEGMKNGASTGEISGLLGKRVAKAAATPGLSQYADDDTYRTAMDYILNYDKNNGFSYEAAPVYADKYAGQVQELLNRYLNREDFSYNADTDPLYASYAKEYLREGDRAYKNTLARTAGSDGIPSSYSVMAASQAKDYYNSQLADKIPELYQLAYSMYQDKGSDMLNQINLLKALEEGDYSKYRDLMSQYNTDRSFDYGKYTDEKAQENYEQEYADEQTQRELENQRYDTEYADRQKQQALENTRYDTEYADKKAQQTYDNNLTEQKYPTVQETPVEGNSLFEAMSTSGSPYSYLSSHYKDYGVAYSSIDKVYGEYEAWAQKQTDSGPEQQTESTKSFTDYNTAVDYMVGQGVSPATAGAVMTKREWQRHKASYNNSGIGGTEVSYFSTYEDYLAAFVQYAVENR